jgi:hypothetical protein
MAIPPLFIQLQSGSLGVPIYIYACATDLLDGIIARRLHAESVLGSMLDAFADFGLVAGVSAYLISVGLLSPWFLALILLAFAQFVAAKPMPDSDPLGRHIGTVLFISLGLSLMYSTSWFVWWSTLMASGYVVASLALRWVTPFVICLRRVVAEKSDPSDTRED